VNASDDEHERRAEHGDGADHQREDRLLPRERDTGVHRAVSGRSVAGCLVVLSSEALHELDGRKRLVQTFDELGLELFHVLFAIEERGDVVANREVQERHDNQRQQRDGDVQLQQNREHDHERRHRTDQGKSANQEVLNRVGIDVHPVDGVPRTGRGVVMKAELLQMAEQLIAKPVHHALAGVDLHCVLYTVTSWFASCSRTPAITSVTRSTMGLPSCTTCSQSANGCGIGC
jgi:hypothetical protein